MSFLWGDQKIWTQILSTFSAAAFFSLEASKPKERISFTLHEEAPKTVCCHVYLINLQNGSCGV